MGYEPYPNVEIVVDKQLGQLRPANTTAASLYSPATGVRARVLNITVCNTSGASAKFRLFVDDDGTTYDETTAHFWDAEVPADSTVTLDVWYAMNDATGNLAVRTDTNDALTFSCYGQEIT